MLDITFIRENPELVQKAAAAKGVTLDIQSLLQKLDELKKASSRKCSYYYRG